MKEGISVRRLRLLARLRSRHRAREGRFMVEGIRGAGEVLRSGVPVEFALVSPRLESTERGRALSLELSAAGVETVQVDDTDLAQAADTETPQGVILVCPEPTGSLDELPEDPAARYLVVDGVQDPGNLGTLVRAAGAFGVSAVILLHGTTDPWAPKAVRAAAGALLGRPVVRAGVEPFLEWARRRGVSLWAAAAGGTDVATLRPSAPWALVVGNEGEGVGSQVTEEVAGTVGVPMPGGTESLNVGVAGAILLYVLAREGQG